MTLAARKPLGRERPSRRRGDLVELRVQQPPLHHEPLRGAAVPAEDPRSALLVGARPLAEVEPRDRPLMGKRGLRVVLVAAGDRADGHALLAPSRERVALVHVERQVEDVLRDVVGVRAPQVDGVDTAAQLLLARPRVLDAGDVAGLTPGSATTPDERMRSAAPRQAASPRRCASSRAEGRRRPGAPRSAPPSGARTPASAPRSGRRTRTAPSVPEAPAGA